MARSRVASHDSAGADIARLPAAAPPGALRVSVVIPAYNEGEAIVPVLERIFESVLLPCEALVVVDKPAADVWDVLGSGVKV